VKLLVVIPSRGMEPLLLHCLDSLYRAIDTAKIAQFHIVIVDNNSEIPYSASMFEHLPHTTLLRLDLPSSFARACNFGVAEASECDVILFLNNDVFLHPRAIEFGIEAMKSEQASICGSRLVYPNNTIQHCGVLFYSGALGPFHVNHKMPSATIPRINTHLQAVTGAFMLVKPDLFNNLKGFDELFPFAYEDVDFCLRAGLAGAFITCSQEVDSLHFGSASYSEHTLSLIDRSRELFFARWRGRFTIDGKEPTT